MCQFPGKNRPDSESIHRRALPKGRQFAKISDEFHLLGSSPNFLRNGFWNVDIDPKHLPFVGQYDSNLVYGRGSTSQQWPPGNADGAGSGRLRSLESTFEI